jgi:predicted aspartyl protease
MTRRFIRVNVVGFAAFLFLMTSCGVRARSKTNDLPTVKGQSERTDLPIRVYRGYLVIVEGSIGGLDHQNLLVDTGTDRSIINARIAHSLGLPALAGKLTVSNAIVETEATVLPELRVGPVQSSSLPVLVHDLGPLEHDLGIPVAAVIGLDMLGQASFRLDYLAKRLVFGPVEPRGIALPFENASELITINLVVGDQRLHVLVDTGAAGLVLFESRVGKRLAFEDLAAQRSDSSLSGSFRTKIVHPGELRLGGRRFRVQKAFLAKDLEGVDKEFDGLLGVGAMGFKSIAFDFASNTVYLQI